MATPEEMARMEAIMKGADADQTPQQGQPAGEGGSPSNPWEWAKDQDPDDIKNIVENRSKMDAASHQRNRESKEYAQRADQVLAQQEQIKNAFASGNHDYAYQLLGVQPPAPQQQFQQPRQEEDFDPMDETPRGPDPRLAVVEQELAQNRQELRLMAANQAMNEQRASLRQEIPETEFPLATKLGLYDQVVQQTIDDGMRGTNGVYSENMGRRTRESLQAYEENLSGIKSSAISEYLKSKELAAAGTSPSTAGPRQRVPTTPRDEKPVDFSKRNASAQAKTRASEILKEHGWE